jgi:hypothetical protein
VGFRTNDGRSVVYLMQLQEYEKAHEAHELMVPDDDKTKSRKAEQSDGRNDTDMPAAIAS